MIFWYSSPNELRQNPDVINSEEVKSKKENQEINVARAGSEVKLPVPSLLEPHLGVQKVITDLPKDCYKNIPGNIV